MTPKTANYGLLIFDALALSGLYFMLREHFGVVSQIYNLSERIVFDTGLYYLLLFSIFPLIRIVQTVILISKARDYHKKLNLLFVVWFILCLVMANVIPYKIKMDLVANGYHYCGQMESHRISRGSNTIYRLSECE